MATLGLEGPWQLTDDGIDAAITAVSPGNYALGYTDAQGTFRVRYVGRSDDNLNTRLHDWTGNSRYKQFKASYATSPKAAFEKECHNYHDFGGADGKLDNEIHPDRPKGANWKCPVCDNFK